MMALSEFPGDSVEQDTYEQWCADNIDLDTLSSDDESSDSESESEDYITERTCYYQSSVSIPKERAYRQYEMVS